MLSLYIYSNVKLVSLECDTVLGLSLARLSHHVKRILVTKTWKGRPADKEVSCDVFNKQLQTADKKLSSGLGVDRGTETVGGGGGCSPTFTVK
jgi:hypothetical protein